MLLLEVEHLSCTLRAGGTLSGSGRRRKILRDATFSVEQGSTFGLLGPSGSGKSTLARCIAGLVEPDGGTLHFCGRQLYPGRRRRIDPRMQLLFQATGMSLDPTMKVGASVGEGFWPLTIGADDKRRRTAEMLDAVGLQAGVLDRYPGQLSGGQRQRIALMRSLLARPSLLILDEPTASLDPITQLNVLDLLRSLQGRLGYAMILITHDMRTAHAMSDAIGHLRDGVLSRV